MWLQSSNIWSERQIHAYKKSFKPSPSLKLLKPEPRASHLFAVDETTTILYDARHLLTATIMHRRYNNEIEYNFSAPTCGSEKIARNRVLLADMLSALRVRTIANPFYQRRKS
jgi:hypothetical protein